MNDLLVENLKSIMVYFRNYTDASSFEDNDSPKIEQFLCDCLGILQGAVEQGNTQLIYDLSDMLQGIPDLKYWKSSKNMRDYWKIYVKSVKKKWKLDMLDRYQPKRFFASKIK